MGCLKLTYRQEPDFRVIYSKKELTLKNSSEKVYRSYLFGFNAQEKVNEIAGVGNHNTAQFWEYDTRLGRRWNVDPVDQISISNYAVNRNNPNQYKDEDGKTPTAVIGVIVGAVEAGIDFGSQVLGNKLQGKSWKESFSEVDYADVGLSFAQGFVDGTTLGVSKFSGASEVVFGALKAGVDWKPATDNPKEKFKMVGGAKLFGNDDYNKNWRKASKDFAIELIGIGAGKMFDDALNIGKHGRQTNKALYRQRGIDEAIGRGILGNMFQVPTDVIIERINNNKKEQIIIGPLKFGGFLDDEEEIRSTP